MSQALSFIPFLIFGLSVTQLLLEWKRLFFVKNYFLPYLLFTIMLTEIAVYSVFVYVQIIAKLPELDYFTYLLHLLPPFLFFMTVNVFTPDQGSDTKEYFIKTIPTFYILLAMFFGSQFLYDLHESIHLHVIRIFAIIVLIISGLLYRKTWMTYLIFIIWLIAISFRGNMVLLENIIK